MPDSLTSPAASAFVGLDRPYHDRVGPLPAYTNTCPQNPGMLHPDAPPILAFYVTPTGLAAINLARCAAHLCRQNGGSILEAGIAARLAFKARLDHPMPLDVTRYLMTDLW